MPEQNKWEFNTTSVFSRNLKAYNAGKRLIVNQGGTSSSKTYSILQMLILVAIYSKQHILINIVSESLPHLKRGCIRDTQKIMGANWDDKRYNKTDHIYDFGNAQIEFFSADNASKLRGGRRDVLYINEANNISKDAFDELDVRTRKATIIDYNPVSEFWAHELIHDSNCEFIHSTYLDSKHVLPIEIVRSIESRKDKDPNWWRVYGLGEVGKLEGLIYPNFQLCDGLPDRGIEFYGLDFGFSNDPSALIRCKVIDDNLYCDQLIYETGLTNQQIARRMESLGIRKNYDEIFADSAEPKSIAEIRLFGFNIKGAIKGRDSVHATIQKVNQYRQFWTKRSVDCIKEQRNYRFIEDSSGRITDKPMDDFDHGLQARGYGLMGKLSRSVQHFARVAF